VSPRALAATLEPTARSTARLVPASTPSQRPLDARLLTVSRSGAVEILPRRDWAALVRAGDLVVANDAATMPASLVARHAPTGARVEIRLAGRRSLEPSDLAFDAILFGEGDHRTRTEDRAAPPAVRPGDALTIEGSSLVATIVTSLDHARFVRLSFAAPPATFWSELARVGRPVQYAHVPDALALWDVWTVIAGPPVAFEPPSAGFLLDWTGLSAIRARGASFATLTHAAGLSSTGDPALDARLPLAEPYRIPARTAALVRQTRARGGRVIAIGTTVVRALEHAATRGLLEGPHPIESIADQRLGSGTALQVVDVLVSGTHEPGTSHHELLRAFVPDERLAHTDRALAAARFRTHEFGDSVWLERVAPCERDS
jgi:S-adenosylmethionine:tRNA ribosyltransferase-isomerase